MVRFRQKRFAVLAAVLLALTLVVGCSGETSVDDGTDVSGADVTDETGEDASDNSGDEDANTNDNSENGNSNSNSNNSNDGVYVQILDGDKTVDIPGDYSTLQQAVDELSAKYRPQQGTRIILNIESGHAPSSGLQVEGGDFGHFWIRSEDSTVTVAGDFSGDFLRGDYARLPVLDALIDMDGQGEDGVYFGESSTARIKADAGIMNAAENGVFGWNGRMYMENSVVTGSGVDNLRISNSDVHARFSDLSGADRNNLRASYGSSVRSTFCDLSDAGAHGVYAVRSRVIAESSDITNAGQHAVFANRGSTVHLTENNGISDLSNPGSRGIFATNASTVEGQEVQVHGASNEGVRAQQNSTVSLRDSDLENNDRAAAAVSGSRIELLNATARNSTSSSDLVVLDGGMIVADGTQTTSGSPAVGDVNLGSFNQWEARGVIFD